MSTWQYVTAIKAHKESRVSSEATVAGSSAVTHVYHVISHTQCSLPCMQLLLYMHMDCNVNNTTYLPATCLDTGAFSMDGGV